MKLPRNIVFIETMYQFVLFDPWRTLNDFVGSKTGLGTEGRSHKRSKIGRKIEAEFYFGPSKKRAKVLLSR